jgi:hypothetical protein
MNCVNCKSMFAAVLVAMLVIPACDSTRDCREGTLFVEVRLTPAGAQADTLRVTVSPDGLSTRSAQFQHPVGQKSGSLELTFNKDEYPTGVTGTVTVVALSQGVVIESRSVATTFGAGCHSLRVDFSEMAQPDGGDMGSSDADIVVPDAMVGKPDTSVLPDAAPGCVPAGPEACYDGLDNDCNKMTDCEDPACQPNSQCVPVNATSGDDVGILLTDATQACPNGFTEKAGGTLGKDIVVGTCQGCTCAANPAHCAANLRYFLKGRDNCVMGSNVAFDFKITDLDQSNSCLVPQYEYVFGAELSPWTVTYALMGCAASGMPRITGSAFASSARLCVAKERGTGCGASAICIRKPTKDSVACVNNTGPSGSACPTGMTSTEWFRKLEDNTRCGPCECGRTENGSCDNLRVFVQNDYSCNEDGNFQLSTGTSSSKQCVGGTQGLYTPGAKTSGTPVAGTCKPSSPVVGQARGTDAITLCCK